MDGIIVHILTPQVSAESSHLLLFISLIIIVYTSIHAQHKAVSHHLVLVKLTLYHWISIFMCWVWNVFTFAVFPDSCWYRVYRLVFSTQSAELSTEWADEDEEGKKTTEGKVLICLPLVQDADCLNTGNGLPHHSAWPIYHTNQLICNLCMQLLLQLYVNSHSKISFSIFPSEEQKQDCWIVGMPLWLTGCDINHELEQHHVSPQPLL